MRKLPRPAILAFLLTSVVPQMSASAGTDHAEKQQVESQPKKKKQKNPQKIPQESPTQSSRPDETFELISGPGVFHGDELKLKSTAKNLITGWYGVFEGPSGHMVKSVSLTVEKAKDEVIDGDKEKTGKKLSIQPPSPAPLFLFKPAKIPFLDSAALESPLAGQTSGQEISPDLSPMTLRLGDKIPEGTIVSTGKRERELGDGRYLYSNIQVFFKSEGKSQRLWTAAALDDSSPRVIWYGDLDRDGKIDLLLNLTDHYNVTSLELFLSSLATKGQLLKKVAQFRITGC